MDGEITKGQLETSENDGYFHYVDFVDGFIGILVYKNIKLYI